MVCRNHKFLYTEELDADKSIQSLLNKELRRIHTTVGDKLDKKLITLCQLHFEIAEIAKMVNQMFSFQMLILMAYGFMAITARIYFVYTGLAGQVHFFHFNDLFYFNWY